MTRPKKTDSKKPWAIRVSSNRDISIVRKIGKIFLIYCEGKSTEPGYFGSFPVNNETEIIPVGTGRSKTALVDYILRIADAEEILKGQKRFDENRSIWCVFDKDIRGEKNEDADFNQAIWLAKASGLNVAYSNDSFELWFLLHDKYIDVKQTRRDYYKYLSAKFKLNYEKLGKSKAFCQSLYRLYLDRQPVAIKNAELLYKYHQDKKTHCQKNPCTTVFKLVKELNKYLKK